jgi:hypothetical protein
MNRKEVRNTLKGVYKSNKWYEKVNAMNDQQVMVIFKRLTAQGKGRKINMKFKIPFRGISNKLPNEVSRKMGLAGLTSKKHAPTILFGVGVVGFVSTVVLASRATLKVESILDEHQKKMEKIRKATEIASEDDYSVADQKRDVTIAYGGVAVDVIKLYGPAVVVGMASICAITGSHVILNRRNVALTAAYKVVEQSFQEYRKRVVDEFGPDKDREFYYAAEDREIVEETEDGPVVRTIKTATNGTGMYRKLFDEHNKNWATVPEYNILFLRAQQRFANDRLKSRGYLLLNDVYDELGIERTKAGCVVGWTWNGGDGFVDFGIWTDKSMDKIHDIVIGREKAIWLDFNVDGVIYDKLR